MTVKFIERFTDIFVDKKRRHIRRGGDFLRGHGLTRWFSILVNQKSIASCNELNVWSSFLYKARWGIKIRRQQSISPCTTTSVDRTVSGNLILDDLEEEKGEKTDRLVGNKLRPWLSDVVGSNSDTLGVYRWEIICTDTVLDKYQMEIGKSYEQQLDLDRWNNISTTPWDVL